MSPSTPLSSPSRTGGTDNGSALDPPDDSAFDVAEPTAQAAAASAPPAPPNLPTPPQANIDFDFAADDTPVFTDGLQPRHRISPERAQRIHRKHQRRRWLRHSGFIAVLALYAAAAATVIWWIGVMF